MDGMAAGGMVQGGRSHCPRYVHMSNEAQTKLHLHYRHMCSASFMPLPLAPPHRSEASVYIPGLLPPSNSDTALVSRRQT